MGYARNRRAVLDESLPLPERKQRFCACVEHFSRILGAPYVVTLWRYARDHGFPKGTSPTSEQLVSAMRALDAERAGSVALLRGHPGSRADRRSKRRDEPPHVLTALALELAELFAQGDYDGVVKRCAKSWGTAAELRGVIENYPATLVPPPRAEYALTFAVRCSGAGAPTWAIDAPLWTYEEGRSELEIHARVSLCDGRREIELEGVWVT